MNSFLPITVGLLSYLSQVIKIWILEYPVKAIFDLTLDSNPVKAKSDRKGSEKGRG
jgi:hypothetical protein